MTTPSAPPQAATDLEQWRQSLSVTRSNMALLDALITPHDARRLVQALPSDDLLGMIHRIGLEDCTELLLLASDAQVRDFIDSESWQRDRLSLERIDPWLRALMQEGPGHLTRRLLALDDELLNWLVRRTAYAVVIEDPEDFEPPDCEYVVTPDNRLCVLFPADDEHRERDLPIKLFLDRLMRDDPEMCINLLLHSTAALDSQLEEQAYYWRQARMADRGYVDHYEALVIYSPPPPQAVKNRRAPDPEAPRRWLGPVLGAQTRLEQLFARFEGDDLEGLQAELAYVANQCLSADLIEPWDEPAIEGALARLREGLILGLDALAGGDFEAQLGVLEATHLSLIFRHGYARMVAVRAPLLPVKAQLEGPAGSLSAVDLPELDQWAEALLAHRHPQRPLNQPLDLAHLPQAREAAQEILALARWAGPDRPADVPLSAWLCTGFLRSLVGLAGLGALPAQQLGAALTAYHALEDLPRAVADWGRAGGHDEPSLAARLAQHWAQSLKGVAPDTFDPQQISLIYIGV